MNQENDNEERLITILGIVGAVIGAAAIIFALSRIMNENMNENVAGVIVPVILFLGMLAFFGTGDYRNSYNGNHDVSKMTGIEYEQYCAERLKQRGFIDVKITPASNDYGADIIARNRDGCWVFQCKRYSGKVPIKAVQEIVSAKVYYNAAKAAIITNSELTSNALKLARVNGVVIMDKFI